MEPEYVEAEFNRLFEADEQLRDLLGEADRYSIEEKESIIRAYKKGGGVAGLAEIIDDEEEEDENGGELADNRYNERKSDEDDETRIDMDDPEDVKIIEEEFKKLYDSDENFRQSFGEEAFELAPI